jgi:hypothetical protein
LAGFPRRTLHVEARLQEVEVVLGLRASPRHLRVKAPAGGVIFRRIGLQIIHLDANGEVTSIDIVGGNFDPLDEFAAVVCPAVA